MKYWLIIFLFFDGNYQGKIEVPYRDQIACLSAQWDADKQFKNSQTFCVSDNHYRGILPDRTRTGQPLIDGDLMTQRSGGRIRK